MTSLMPSKSIVVSYFKTLIHIWRSFYHKNPKHERPNSCFRDLMLYSNIVVIIIFRCDNGTVFMFLQSLF